MGSTQVDEPDPLDPEIIQRLDNRFSYRDIPEDYYTDEDGDEVCAIRESSVCYCSSTKFLQGSAYPCSCRFLDLLSSPRTAHVH